MAFDNDVHTTAIYKDCRNAHGAVKNKAALELRRTVNLNILKIMSQYSVRRNSFSWSWGAVTCAGQHSSFLDNKNVVHGHELKGPGTDQ